MDFPEHLEQENRTLRERLSQLTEASARINDSPDVESLLQEVVDSARLLTDSLYGVIVLLHSTGQVEDRLTSGLTPDETNQLSDMPGGLRISEFLSEMQEPLRLQDFQSHARALGLPELRSPRPVNSPLSLLAAPIRHRGERLGAIYVASKESGREFTPEDEQTLVMFASQAAVAIGNARNYRDEQRAGTDLETLVDTAPIGILAVDPRSGSLVLVNREARRILSDPSEPETTDEELLNRVAIRRADGHQFSLAEFPLAEVLSADETIHTEEIAIQVPGGRSVSILVNATPIRSADGGVETLVMTMQDMGPLRHLEQLRSDFLGIVGHELRTPLSSIKGSASTLLESASSLDPAEIHQFYRIINEQADYMRELISDLVDVASIETGTLSIRTEPANVSRLVDDAKNTLLSSGGRDNIHIYLAPDLPSIMADRRRIIQILNNLLTNASRNSHSSSAIRISAEADSEYVTITVADDGRGLSPEHLPQLFRKSSNIDERDRARDLGLGLAICKGIVDAHGGRIWAESDGLGLGSRFMFTVPVTEEPASAPPYNSSRGAARHRRSGRAGVRRVLAVDDDPWTLRQVRDSLTNAGYELHVTGDPTEVASLMESFAPDVVLLDLMLPGADGIELMSSILAEYDVPVMFLSAYVQDEVIARAFEMGAVDYVIKPFSPVELAARVRAALRKETRHPVAYAFEDLIIDYAAGSVSVAGTTVDMTAIEFRLLTELSVNAGSVMTHDHLLQRVWGENRTGDARPLRTVVKNLRRKLGDSSSNPTYILTVPGMGYRMVRAEQ